MPVDKKALWQEALTVVGVTFAIKGTESYDKVMKIFKELATKAEQESAEQKSQVANHWSEAVKQVTTKGYVTKGTPEYIKALEIYRKLCASDAEKDPVKACWRKACLDKAKREIVMKQDPEYAEVKSYFRDLLAASAGPS